MLEREDQIGRYCVIGAGAAGLAVAKTFKERGIPFDCLEREADIGGLWNANTPSGIVYKTCHMVSSKEFTAFEDFPFPEDAPIYPSHAQALEYLKAYAEHFGLLDDIAFNKPVENARFADGVWRVRVKGERSERLYRGVVMANGHHDEPRMPNYPGVFSGDVLHSRHYKGPEQLAGKRVLLVGAGNSGCDIALDGVHHGAKMVHSLRRGYYFVPKFIVGFPTDDVVDFAEKLHMPRWLKQRVYWLVNRLTVGPLDRYGLPLPEHRILDTHPTISSEIPSHVAHGRIEVKPDIARFEGRQVHFKDGSATHVDIVIFATGYEVAFPFVDDELILGPDGLPKLYLNVFHPERDDFFAAGLIQANGSIWRLSDLQAQLIAGYILAMQQDPRRAAWFRKLKSQGPVNLAGRGSFVASDRHKLEHDYYVYRRALKRLLRKFGTTAGGSYIRQAPARHAADEADAARAQRRIRAA